MLLAMAPSPMIGPQNRASPGIEIFLSFLISNHLVVTSTWKLVSLRNYAGDIGVFDVTDAPSVRRVYHNDIGGEVEGESRKCMGPEGEFT
jgi:hypothetical protein